MKQRILSLLAVTAKNVLIAIFCTIPAVVSAAIGTNETVHVATPGTLEELMLDVESANIQSLTITGCLNAYDIEYIITPSGKMGTVEHLDISGITLMPGDHPYAQYQVIKDEQLTGGTMGLFYISENYREEFTSVTGGMGDSKDILRVYSPNLDGAFAYTNFKSIVLPDYLDKIPQFMFKGSTKLESVAMKRPLSEIGQHAFYASENLKSLPDLSSLTSIGERAFERADVSSLGFYNTTRLKTIGWRAFENSNITSINLSAVESMGARAFNECGELTGRIDLSSLSSVPAQAFAYTVISDVNFSSNLREIGDHAFSTTKLTDVVIPEGTTSIMDSAFERCWYLTNASIPSSVITLSQNAFADTPFEKNLAAENGVIYINDIAFKLLPSKISEPTTIIIKEGTISIADNFSAISYGTDDYECKDILENINSISFPSTLKRIGSRAFITSGWTKFNNLGEVIFPEGLEYIGEEAFANDEKMSADKLPESLKYIGKKAFEYTNFTQVTLPENLEYVGLGAFAATNVSSVKLFTKNLSLNEQDSNGGWNYVFEVANAMKVYIGAQVNNVGAQLFCAGNPSFSTQKILKVEFEDRTTPISFGDNSFYGDLTVTNFPSMISYIGDGAFFDCIKLNFDLSALTETKYIGKNAFNGCTYLTGSLILNCDSIKTAAFRNTGLESVTLGDNVHFVGDGVFSECSGLEEFHYNAVDCSIPYSMFELNRSVVVGPIPFSRSGSETGMTVYVGKNVRVIPDDVFKSTISSLIFEGYEDSAPSIITDGSFSIGARSFLSGRNISLPTISPIPTNTVSIGEEAFYIDTNSDLTYVPGTRFVVPASVKEIGANAFSGYEELYMYPLEPPVTDADYGYGYGVQRIYVRPEALESYLQAKPHWHEYEILPMHDTNTIPVKVNKDGGATAGSQIGVPVSLELPKDIDLSTNLGESIVWESKDNSIASVDRNTGEITPKALGVTSITVKKVSEESVVSRASTGKETLISIEFWVTKLEMSESVDIQAGHSRKLTYKVDAGSNKYPYELETEWSSSDPDVAEVSADGTVTANGIGSAVITLKTDIGDCETIVNVIESSGKDPFDINGSGKIDVSDVVLLVDKILKNQTDVAVHDLNGDNQVNVSDIVLLVSRILNGSVAKATGTRSTDASEVPVNFAMNGNYTAMQTDIVVADGARIEDVTLNAALARTHTLAYSELSTGRYRVIVYSLANLTMDSGTGEPLFSLAMTGDTRIETEATIFVEAQPVTTAIDTVGNDAATIESVTYFDLQGRHVSPEATGILIERTVLTDGRVLTKKIHR